MKTKLSEGNEIMNAEGRWGDFAEQLTKFERSLNGRDIAPRFLAQIQSQIDDAWNRYLDQLSEVFADVPHYGRCPHGFRARKIKREKSCVSLEL